MMTMPRDTVVRDRYRIGRVLGSGLASTTYLAEDTQSGERCVVKELSVARAIGSASTARSFDPADFTKVVELFEREARVLAHLDHPGVPRLIDHFTDDGDDDTRLYTVQEHVEGHTLEALVQSGRHFSEEEARELLRNTAEILDHLHGLSPPLVHRDIKPSNVLVDDDGSVHLIDFGAVKNAVAADDLGGKTIVGTFGYMPVEQYEGRALPASDIYALGGTMVYLLSHRSPPELPKDGMKVDFRSHVNVSDDFARVIERMVEPDWRHRQQNGGELLRDLDPDAHGSRTVESSHGAVASSRGWNPGARGEASGDRSPVARRAWRLSAVLAAAVLGVATGMVTLRFTEAPGPEVSASAMISEGEEGPGEPIEPAVEETTEPPPVGTGTLRPVAEVDGVLRVDIFRDFEYRPTGWAMGRSVGQTTLQIFTDTPREELVLPPEIERRGVRAHFGFLSLGNSSDYEVGLVLTREGDDWSLWVDDNNNEDLTDDGPPHANQGTGTIMAANVSVEVDIVHLDGEAVRRPYNLWIWFDLTEDGNRVRTRFYTQNHYRGSVLVAGSTYAATAYELLSHDALYRDAGLCIDLDGDNECNEDYEIFYDGGAVPFPGKTVRLELRYP